MPTETNILCMAQVSYNKNNGTKLKVIITEVKTKKWKILPKFSSNKNTRLSKMASEEERGIHMHGHMTGQA